MSLGTDFGGLHQQLRRVRGGSHGGAQKDVLVLGQVLGWGLLGCPGTVEQLPLQQRQVRLEPDGGRVTLLFSQTRGSDSFGGKDTGVASSPDYNVINRLVFLKILIYYTSKSSNIKPDML